MKIKALFNKNDQLLAWMEVTEAPIDFEADNGKQVYELEVDDASSDKHFSGEISLEQMEEEIRTARKRIGG